MTKFCFLYLMKDVHTNIKCIRNHKHKIHRSIQEHLNNISPLQSVTSVMVEWTIMEKNCRNELLKALGVMGEEL